MKKTNISIAYTTNENIPGYLLPVLAVTEEWATEMEEQCQTGDSLMMTHLSYIARENLD